MRAISTSTVFNFAPNFLWACGVEGLKAPSKPGRALLIFADTVELGCLTTSLALHKNELVQVKGSLSQHFRDRLARLFLPACLQQEQLNSKGKSHSMTEEESMHVVLKFLSQASQRMKWECRKMTHTWRHRV